MSRAIRFRAWDIGAARMVQSPSIAFLRGWLGDDVVCCVEHLFEKTDGRLIWMQFTGLVDMDGKEIYEGDVVEFREGEDRDVYVVKFRVGMFFLEHPEGGDYNEALSFSWNGDNGLLSRRVIGNIHEHPELLEVQS